MKISHEVPLCLLETSRYFNDYDYALVHLFDKYEQYYNFYRDSLKVGREVFLDNSVFELGKAFDRKKYAESIIRLKPTYYIIPDILEDSTGTRLNYFDFVKNYSGLPGKRIGVVQGKNKKELVECYRFMADRADMVAISFDYSWYEEIGNGENKYQKWADGRMKFIEILESQFTIKKPLHLLGVGVPQEISFYRNKKYIKSIDTSNPIVHAIRNIRYTKSGLETKESIKLADLIKTPLTEIDQNLLYYNIKTFREFIQ